MPFQDGKYIWTNHSRQKMRYYRLTESRVKRIIRHPTRVEEGILEKGIAVMQPASASAPAGRPASPVRSQTPEASDCAFGHRTSNRVRGKNYSEIWTMYIIAKEPREKKIKIITAWRYPGKSPERDPIPRHILQEVRKILVT